MYFKGALFINTLRSIVDDDKRWWKLIREYYNEFRYRDILTEDVVAFFNRRTGRTLTPVFNQYLRRTDLPVLELTFDEGSVSYRWKADEPGFAMPVKVGRKGRWQTIQPTREWQSMKTEIAKADFEVATELYFIKVTR
jgi:aminopeptidase N